jgi:hypothetical protein
MHRNLATLALLACPLAACSIPLGSPAAAPEDRQLAADCRVEADRIYAAQNRADLSTRSQTDTPFASNGIVGVPSDGLSGRYAHEQLFRDCVRQNQAASPGPAVRPAAAVAPPAAP